MRVTRLAASVGGLTANQKEVALQVYTDEFESLLAIPLADRMSKGGVYRQAAAAQIQMVLNSGQQTKAKDAKAAVIAVKITERLAVEKFLRSSPAIAAQVGIVQRLESTGANFSVETTTATVGNTATPVPVAAGARRGKFTYKVVGASVTETFDVTWEKATPTAELKVVKLENSRGGIVRL